MAWIDDALEDWDGRMAAAGLGEVGRARLLPELRQAFEAAAREGAAVERQACAALCDQQAKHMREMKVDQGYVVARQLARELRRRGEA